MVGIEAGPLAGTLNAAMSRFHRRGLLVLAYHGVDDAEMFGRQMRTIRRTHRPVTGAEVARAATGAGALPERAVLVTFDDGDRSVLDAGAGILEGLGIPAVAFVLSDLIGTDAPFWWDEVRELVDAGGTTPVAGGTGVEVVRSLKTVPDDRRRAAIEELRSSAPAPARRRAQLSVDDLVRLESVGIEVGSHTASHPCLDQCAPDVVADELTRSKAALEEMLGHEVQGFAYPNGNVTGAVERQVAEAGYVVAYGFDHRVSPNPPPRRHLISRVRVDSTTGPDRFAMLTSGAHSLVHRARGRR